MFLLQPILDFVHFLTTTIFYVWSISLHLGRGICLLLKNIAFIIQDISKGLVILGEDLLRFFTELNTSIDNVAIYIGSSANNGFSCIIDAIAMFWHNMITFFSTSEIRTRLLASRLGIGVMSLFALLYGALKLIVDTTWWLLTLVPRSIIKLLVVIADFCIFSFDAACKAILYTVQTLLSDIFRITISLFVIFMIWKKRQRLRLLLLRCYIGLKTLLHTRIQLFVMRWRNYNRPRFGNLARPPMRRSPGLTGRPSLDAVKLSPQQVCVVCRDNPKNVLLWPCRHMCLCEDCADRICEAGQETCPLCRGQVEFTLSIYT